jgi:hypothetical protein
MSKPSMDGNLWCRVHDHRPDEHGLQLRAICANNASGAPPQPRIPVGGAARQTHRRTVMILGGRGMNWGRGRARFRREALRSY